MTDVTNDELTNRSNILLELVRLSGSLAEIKTRLSKYPWESEQEIVVLRPEHVICILQRFANKEVALLK